MKKITKLVTMLAAALIMGAFLLPAYGCTPRREVLRIYNWGYYMNPDVMRSFETWYQSRFGTRIRVRETTFTSNEEMFRQIRDNRSDFDIAVPSDYMVSKMFAADLLQPLDRDIITDEVLGRIYQPLLNNTNSVTGTTSESLAAGGNIYALPYLWGTMGIMFDSSIIRYEYIDFWGWEALFREIPAERNPAVGPPALTEAGFAAVAANSNFLNDRIYMKNSFRDSMVAAQLYARRNQLLELSDGGNDWSGDDYQALLRQIFHYAPNHENAADIDPEIRARYNITTQNNIGVYDTIFRRQRALDSFFKYEVDVGMIEMMDGLDNRGFMGIFWSCDAGYVVPFNPDLAYHIPREGSNLYVDAMVIPVHARNPEAANWFLYYLNMFDADNPENSAAWRNMSYVGAPAGVAGAMDAFRDGLEDGTARLMVFGYMGDEGMTLDELFSDDDGLLIVGGSDGLTVKDMFIGSIMFPDQGVVNRTEYMRDWGAAVEVDLALMWADILAYQPGTGCGSGSIAAGLLMLLPAALFVGVMKRRR